MNAHLQRGLLLFQQSRWEMAEKELAQSLQDEPEDPYALGLLAIAQAGLKKYPEADQSSGRAIALAPDFDFAHYARALVLYQQEKFEDALRSIQEAIRLGPERVSHWAMLSQLQLARRQWAAALASAEQGLKLDGEDSDCANLRAHALVKLGRRQEAIAATEATLSRNPEDSFSHANQGWTLLENRQPQKALDHFREALRIDPDSGWAREGIVEAMKARYKIYAVVLQYFFFMSRLSTQVQWAILLGGFLLNRTLASLAASNPKLAPYVLPVRILYVVFALLTWTANPLFNLLLRLNRYGRLALSEEQMRASNWFGSALLVALVSLGLSYFFSPFLMLAFVAGCLSLPIAGIYNLPAGKRRRLMAGYTILVGALGVAGFGTILGQAFSELPLLNVGMGLVLLSAFGSLFSGWIINVLLLRR